MGNSNGTPADTTRDHLANARSYIAIAESADSEREAYEKAADEIIAWLAEDKTRTQRQAAAGVGKVPSWVSEIVTWRTSGRPGDPFARATAEAKGRGAVEATKVIRERPEVIHEAIKADPDLAAKIIGDDPQVQSRLQGALNTAAAADRRRLPIPDRAPQRDQGEILRTVLGLSVMAKGLLGDAESLAGLPGETKSHVRDVFADVREALDTAEAVMAGEDVQTTIDRILAEAR